MNRRPSIQNVKVKDPFWSERQQLITRVVIPYQEKILNDQVEGAEKSHAFANFRIAAGQEKGAFYGMVFQDSDVAKWLEGVAYSLANEPDPMLEQRADAVIELIGKAQQEDGYLDTYFILKEPERKWTDLQECHELYCAGHMMEAAAAYYEATGKDKLLRIMQRTADCINRTIGPEDGKIHGVPGHEEIELGLLRMYGINHIEPNLSLASYFINERGKDPEWFSKEKESRGYTHWPDTGSHDVRDYHQIFAPIREQKEARGHAVRAMYFYTAAAELAQLSNDQTLAKACERLWENVTQRQMYITGGIGQVAAWEGFSHDYDLPNDTVYAETCASIGLIFFADRMLGLCADRKYAEVMERALYNGVLSGMNLDGQGFFYVNPLECNPDVSGILPGYKHILPRRPKWFACACCPPNLVRLIESIGTYAWHEADNTIYSHLFIGGDASFENAVLSVTSEMPWTGKVTYRVEESRRPTFTLALRLPSYAQNLSVRVFSGDTENDGLKEGKIIAGYLYLDKNWKAGDTVEMTFDMPVQKVYANPLVRADAGCVAFQRGPIVYCFEGIDQQVSQQSPLQTMRVLKDAAANVEIITDGLLQGMYAIKVEGCRMVCSTDDLYQTVRPDKQKMILTGIPYFAWSNRGTTQMRVWLPEIE